MTNIDPQIELWNGNSGERWVRYRDETDLAFGVLSASAMVRLNAQTGERVIDVGCGAGTTLLEIAKAVGPAGHVVGIDACDKLARCAQLRTAHIPQVQVLCGDATQVELPPSYDALFSRFGMMFFASPITAFRNLRNGLRPGGRLVFTVWQAANKNGWHADLMSVVLPHVSETPAPSPPRAPGTFAMSERLYLEEILSASGFRDTLIEDVREPVQMGSGGVAAAVEFALHVGPAASLTEKQTPETQQAIRAGLTEFFSGVACGENISLPGAAWLVSAVA